MFLTLQTLLIVGLIVFVAGVVVGAWAMYRWAVRMVRDVMSQPSYRYSSYRRSRW